MSVTEIAPRGEEFERTPPHDLAAEQCVLGGMLLSKDAISDVLEVIRPADHYRPAHQLVHEVILDLYARGEPADAVTVAAELTKRGDIARVGGAPYLHTLIASVPTAANAGYYARIVRERAILRRLVEVGTRIVQLGYAGDGDADELVDRAEAEVYGVTERRVSDDYLPLSEIMPGALEEIEAIGSRGGALTGVPTGFANLDALTNGLHPGQMIVIAARPALGKALALDTPLTTPAGWTTMGEVGVGDQLIGADGRPVRVLAATEVMYGRPCYEVVFSGGEIIVADGEHQWVTWTPAEAAGRSGDGDLLPGPDSGPGGARRRHDAPVDRWRRHRRVLTTAQLAAALQCGPPRHSVAIAGPLDLPDAELPVPPYVLGAWLGARAGLPPGASPAAADPEVVMRAEAAWAAGDGSVAPRAARQARLRGLGVLGELHIPARYLRGSPAQRRALLAGLLDAAGTVPGPGAVQLALSSPRLAADAGELVHTLGYRCAVTAEAALAGSAVLAGSAAASARSLVRFSTDDQVFWMSGKQQLHKQSLLEERLAEERLTGERTRPDPRLARWRDIVAVRPVPSRPVRCVQVSAPDQLYLAGREMIPTHNSTLALDLARAAAIKHGLTAAIFSLEMSRNEITMRLLSAEARVPLHSMRTGQLGDEDWTRLARRMSEVVDAPLFIDDSPNMSMMEIRAKCRRMKQRHDLRLVIIDYLQLMTSPKRVENRQQEVSDMSRSLKLLAKELDVPVIAVAQLNRGPEQRTDKRPLLADLRESGCLTADTTLLRADTGAPVTMQNLIDGGHDNVLVWSVDDRQQLVAAPVVSVFAAGVKEIYRLKLASGRQVKASGNHPFLTAAGWQPLERLAEGERVAIPRRIPAPLAAGLGWTEGRLGLLAHMIGDGCVLSGQPVRYTSEDEANHGFVESAAAAEFGITPRRVRQENWWHSYLPAPYRCARGRRNPVRAWFAELGIDNLRSYQKRIPDIIYSASDNEIRTFLHHLWATDGCIWHSPAGTSPPQVYYASTSRELADGVGILLGRLGIVARIRPVRKAGYRPGYHVIIAAGPSMRTFCRSVGAYGVGGQAASQLLAYLGSRAVSPNVDTLPKEVWDLVKAERSRSGISERQFQAAIGTQALASSDIFWDSIVGIEPLGRQPVFDATVKGTHNFIADGVLAHNSIEQDSDVVILLHREDAYERESPRAGEADFIVAKHRNGPTATVTVAFQGHYSRFVDMAPM